LAFTVRGGDERRVTRVEIARRTQQADGRDASSSRAGRQAASP
jgi:hypothetical protein